MVPTSGGGPGGARRPPSSLTTQLVLSRSVEGPPDLPWGHNHHPSAHTPTGLGLAPSFPAWAKEAQDTVLGPGGGTVPDARQMGPSGKGMQNGQDLHEQVSSFF